MKEKADVTRKPKYRPIYTYKSQPYIHADVVVSSYLPLLADPFHILLHFTVVMDAQVTVHGHRVKLKLEGEVAQV